MREADIIYESGRYWVARQKDAFVVYVTGLTHSKSDSAYAKNPAGQSIAIARCDYLAKQVPDPPL